MIDTRQRSHASVAATGAIINSLHAYCDGNLLISGDSKGGMPTALYRHKLGAQRRL